MIMKNPWQQAKARYQAEECPPELEFAVASALRAGERKRRQRRTVRRGLSAVLSTCACFMLLVNLSPNFARAVSQVPVLADLARVFTVTEYKVEDRDHLIDVRLPALELKGATDLEQRINTEISTRIDQVLQEAEERARETRQAYVDTGGDPEDFMPIAISVDYEIKCQNDQYLSFVLTKTETLASAYTEYYAYNIDLQAGKEITLRDIFGSDYKEIINAAVSDEIARRSQESDVIYFAPEQGGFQTIADDQRFYLDQDGTPVIVFEKYEIAPGYMGEQEFRVPVPGQGDSAAQRTE